MDLRLLGPVECLIDGDRLKLGGPRQRAVLADLALHAGRTVLTSKLVDDVWGDAPPETAVHTVEAYISRLRRVLHAPGRAPVLLTTGSGYLLDVPPEDVDSARFDDLVRQGRKALDRSDAAAAESLFTSALGLWRGPALADIRDAAFAPPVAARLQDQRLAVLEAATDLRLAAGRHVDLIPELQAATAAEPYREHFHAQLMLALYRSGRQVDALAAYQHARTVLVRELGVRPGRELRELESAILGDDPHLRTPIARHAGEPTAIRIAPREREELPTETSSAVDERIVIPTPGRRRRTLRARGLEAVVLVAALVGLMTTSASLPLRTSVDPVGVSQLSLGNDRVTRSTSLAGDPGAAVLGDGSLWVTSPEAHALFRLDPSSGHLQDTIPVGAGAGAIALTGPDVWVANALDGTVSCVDSRTDRVVRTVRTGSEPTGLTTRGDQVWVADATDSTLSAVTSRSGRSTARRSLTSAPFGEAYAANSLWVTNPSSDSITRLGVDGGPAVQIRVGSSPTAITFGLGSIWVTNTLDGTVSRVDPSTDTVSATIPVGSGPDAIAIVGSKVWVADRLSSALTELDARTDSVATSIRIDASPIALASNHAALWFATQPSGAGRGTTTTLRVAQSAPPTSIDPALAFPDMPFQFFEGTYDTLLTYNRVGGSSGLQLVPDLALTMPTITNAGTSYTFVLRRAIRYSDGDPIRPGDFAYGIKRVLQLNATAASFLTDIVGATACLAHAVCDLARGITVSDRPPTVTFHLIAPDPTFVNKLAFGFTAPIPASVPDHDTVDTPVPSTGPYMISRYRVRHEVVFTRNPYFHQWSAAADPTGFPNSIVWTFGASLAAETSAVLSGRDDWTDDNLPDAAALLADAPRQTHVNPNFTIDYAAFNTRVAPFNRLAVRQAFSFAADRTLLAKELGGPAAATPTCQILPPGIPGYRRYCPFTIDPGATHAWTGPNLVTARKLVTRSGTKGMRVTVWSQGDDAITGRFIVSVLRELGYRATMITPSPAVLAEKLNDSREHAQATDGSWTADYPSASDFFDTFFRCSAFRLADPAATRNGAFFCRPHIDAEMNLADRQLTTSPAQAALTWSKVDQAVTDEAPWVPLANLTWTDFLSPQAANYQYNPAFGLLLDQLDLRHS